MKKYLSAISMILFISLALSAAAYSEDVYQIVIKSYNIDQGKDSRTDMKMELESRGKKDREREITSWRIERGDEDKSLMYFRTPESVKGTGFLVWEHKNKDDDQWLYLPAFKKVRRISASEKDKSFMGTDFTYNDITQPHPDEFAHKLLGSETIEGSDCYKIESIHKTYTDDPAYKDKDKYQYSKGISWIRKDNYVTIKGIMYDKKGQEYKLFRAGDVRKVDGIWTAHVLEMENIKDKHKTILTITAVKYNTGINDSFFTERELTKPR
ncbi:MAG: outer membrane lipoprotein-sorting protein [Spirochaetes bacterium]|nr:outer membrane lipoprotein-sorting protein [Spirochaetota bacterium]